MRVSLGSEGPKARIGSVQSQRPVDNRKCHEDRQRETTLSQRRGDQKAKTTMGDHEDLRADGFDEGLEVDES